MDFPQKLRTLFSPRSKSYKDMVELLAQRRAARILVVDDNPDTMMLMRELLQIRGYDVVAVPDASHAEAEIRHQLPDLILSDVVMPGKSGYEFCRELKENPSTRLIPFVLITGLSDREDKLHGIEAGADDLLCTLGLSVESRDPYTEGHCERLAQNASNLGRHLGLDEEAIVALRRGGYLHDLGKIAVPDEILKKGSNLTPEEWEVMKQHPITGENICRPLKSLRLILPIIRHHHEHTDGSGYPDGLRKRDIPLLPRVLQVVDVYDALRTARPYKPALSHDQSAITMREEARAGLWDEELVGEFFSMLEKRQVA